MLYWEVLVSVSESVSHCCIYQSKMITDDFQKKNLQVYFSSYKPIYFYLSLSGGWTQKVGGTNDSPSPPPKKVGGTVSPVSPPSYAHGGHVPKSCIGGSSRIGGT